VISIVDYGAGNLRSVQNTLDELGAQYQVVTGAAGVRAGHKVILPGVGHFGQMMQALDSLNLRNVLREQIDAGVPFLGICLGLHALFETSEEAPDVRGLGLYPGNVQRFDRNARVPHMGWNRLTLTGSSKLLQHLPPDPFVYFAHSYYAPLCPQTVASCTYTVPYTAVLESGNVYAVQFHPEKSGPLGLAIVNNFVEAA
jgi:imidazole glycerol phosphate synthase glutamine amidotransferase subunit